MLFMVLGRSVPGIVLGPALIIVFSVKLNLLPVVNPYIWIEGPNASNMGTYLATAALPVITLDAGMSASICSIHPSLFRQLRNV